MAISDKLGLLQKELMRKLLHLAVLVETLGLFGSCSRLIGMM
jgi:F0F1-type ATP synthase membrane subunit c/vacuolar-type H+-ATPase subunit K